MSAKVTTIVELKSDLTGKPATETRTLTVNGETATVHLTDAEAGVFDKAMGKYFTKASSVEVNPNTLRAWAREQGYPVGERGRISADIRAAYRGETVEVPAGTAEVLASLDAEVASAE